MRTADIKRLVLAGFLAAGVFSAPRDLRAGQLGIGPIIGDPTGVTLKYWFNNIHAADFGLGASQSLTLHADYSWHAWKAVPQLQKGDLGAYLSLGGRLETQSRTDFGIRTLAGLSYWPDLKRPVEFFLEIGPVLRVAPDTRVRVDGGFGLRYYFQKVK